MLKMKIDWPMWAKRLSRFANYEQSIGFVSGSHKYIMDCNIISEDKDSIKLDNNTLNSLEWSNEVNNLCLNGVAEVLDRDGSLNSLFCILFMVSPS